MNRTEHIEVSEIKQIHNNKYMESRFLLSPKPLENRREESGEPWGDVLGDKARVKGHEYDPKYIIDKYESVIMMLIKNNSSWSAKG
jgi:hypothetical protein